MKGKLKKIEDKWFVEYSGISYSGGNPKQLGGYTKKVEQKRLELTPNNQRYLSCFLQVDKDTRVDFKEVFINPMGREVDHTNLGQNHSGCLWYAELTDEKEDLGYTTKMGIEVSDEMVRATMIPKEYFGKDEQKQNIVDMMEFDEKSGLYDEEIEPYENYLKRLKDRRTEDNYKYSDEDFEKYDEYIKDCWKGNMSVYKCLEFMYFAEKEIKVEDVFNDEKKERANRVIQQHKVLKDLSLVNPAHLIMTSDGYGEFPDGYKLTEKGIQYIIEQLNKE